MKMKVLTGLLALALLLTMVTPLAVMAESEKIEITFWHNWSNSPGGKALEDAAALFNAKQDKIVVKPVYVAQEGGDSITSKMITAVASGTAPETMLASRYGIAEYMDALTTVNDLVERDGIDMNMFYPWAVEESTYDGKILGLPYDGTSRALYYNKDHFAAAGLDPENPPKTIEELTEAAQKLTLRDGNRVTQFGLIPWMGEGWLYSWGWSFGGSFLDKETGKVTPNQQPIVEALTWMTDVAKDLGVQDVNSFTSSSGVDAANPFIAGQLSMIIQGNWFAAQIAQYNPNLNYGVCDIPSPGGAVPATTFVGGRAIIIPKGVEGARLDAAWEWVKFLCTSEEAQSLKKNATEYSAVTAVNEKIYAGDPLMEQFLRVLPNGHNRPVVLAGNMMWDELAKTPDRVLNGDGTPQEILDGIEQQINMEIEMKKAQYGVN